MNQIRPKRIALFFPFIFFVATSMFARSWVSIFSSSWPTLLLGCLLASVVVPVFFRTRWFLFIAIYSLVVILNWQLGDEFFKSFGFVANEIAHFFLFSAVIYYLFESDDRKCIETTYYVMLIMVGIAAVGSFYVNSFFSGIVRYQNSIVEADDISALVPYYRLGLTNYLLPHGLPVLIAPLILLTKRIKYIRRKPQRITLRITSFLFLAFTLLLSYLSGSTTVLLLSLFSFVALFFKEDEGVRPLTFFSLAFGAIILVLVIELFPSILGIFTGDLVEEYSSHIEDLSNYSSEGEEGNTSLRLSLYLKSLGGFFANPLFGTNGIVSGHSVILDRFGTLGLLGGVPFSCVLYFFYNTVIKKFGKGEKPFFTFSFLIGLLMILLKGIEDKEIWLMLFVVSPLIMMMSRYLGKEQ